MLIESPSEARRVLLETKRVAIVGIKPESHASEPAHYVSAFLQRQGVEVVLVRAGHDGSLTTMPAVPTTPPWRRTRPPEWRPISSTDSTSPSGPVTHSA